MYNNIINNIFSWKLSFILGLNKKKFTIRNIVKVRKNKFPIALPANKIIGKVKKK